MGVAIAGPVVQHELPERSEERAHPVDHRIVPPESVPALVIERAPDDEASPLQTGRPELGVELRGVVLADLPARLPPRLEGLPAVAPSPAPDLRGVGLHLARLPGAAVVAQEAVRGDAQPRLGAEHGHGAEWADHGDARLVVEVLQDAPLPAQPAALDVGLGVRSRQPDPVREHAPRATVRAQIQHPGHVRRPDPRLPTRAPRLDGGVATHGGRGWEHQPGGVSAEVDQGADSSIPAARVTCCKFNVPRSPVRTCPAPRPSPQRGLLPDHSQ